MTAPFYDNAARINTTTGRVSVSPLADPEAFAEYHNLTVFNKMSNFNNVFVEFEDIHGQRLIITGEVTTDRDDSDAILPEDLTTVEPHSLERDAQIAAASDWLFDAGLEAF